MKVTQLRDLEFNDFPLENFVDAGKVANEGDPQLKAAADIELYNLEKRALYKLIMIQKTKILPVKILMTIPA